ncbi:arginine--tRNA ligase [Chromatiales bacterium (ex Bugula neritina AB1)]|nr:arginine--tRNA ligase [Chromatiales bacterium (ex Bugula neritina AB1)]
MNALQEIKGHFATALAQLTGDPGPLLAMIRPTQDGKFGDYQANCAMPLAKQLGKAPREIAADLVASVELSDLCETIEVAGPGFINLTLKDSWLTRQLAAAQQDERLGIENAQTPRTVVVDYSSPNVAKPMHVGHIRSTVIGAALANIHRFLGHRVITDNHLGDWGTQFGMIIYGYKHFVDAAAYRKEPVSELSRLYKYVRVLMDYHSAVRKLPEAREALEKMQLAQERVSATEASGKSEIKQKKKDISRLNEKIAAQTEVIEGLAGTIEKVKADAALLSVANEHAAVGQAVLDETVRLHSGNPQNREYWDEFLPYCLEDINRLYDRLGVRFDYILGESFYHDQLGPVVEDFIERDLARESDGAICVFLDGYEAPMIIRKKDGAYLYPTTDLATIQHRVSEWQADTMLYVVDHRQGDHFDKLFDAARLWGYTDVEMTHVSFGTVLGDDGTPFKTRAGDTVGLEGLLDEAESRALAVAKAQNPDLEEGRQAEIGRVVGIGALKYADLSQNRSSDYKFSYDKMLALRGNTATYLQYANARVHGILRNMNVSVESLRGADGELIFAEPVERQMAIQLLRFSEALDDVLVDYKPNLLCNYLFDLAQLFARFFDQCPVKDAGSVELQQSRLKLCDLTARTLTTGLDLLGIEALDRI